MKLPFRKKKQHTARTAAEDASQVQPSEPVNRVPNDTPRSAPLEEVPQAQPSSQPINHVANVPASASPEESAYGIKCLVEGEAPSIDIVAVHGLDGHREKSWTADNGVLWLQTLLPKDVPNARVLTYGYDSRTRSSEHLSHQTLYGHSMSLISGLSLYRRRTKTERRPIIFLAHSLGGIVVKSALIHSNMASVSDREHIKAIKLSTYGVMFFGTPHQGTESASWGKVLANVTSVFRHTNTAILEHLERDSEWLEIQLEQYKTISSEVFTIFCFESYPTPLPAGRSMMMVPKVSAVVPGMRDAESVEIRKNHITLVKFGNRADDDFQTVAGHISIMCESAQEKVAQNWEDWEGIKRPVTILHDRKPKPSPSSTVPFRRDDHFISRDSLDKIRQICARPAGRAALFGLGGVGKSQIAIEHTYQIQDESPTTWVFWVHASTRARFEESYRRIAEKTEIDGWDDPKADILRLVRKWLCDESNGRWVMVIDNADDSAVFFPTTPKTQVAGLSNLDEAAQLLSEFLPQSPNGSILITSRDREVARRLAGRGDCLVEVKPMDEGEALALLQKKLSNVNEPDAFELVEALDYMPLAITQAAAYIEQRAPRTTVSRYIDEFRQNDQDRARLLTKDVGDGRRDGRAYNSIIATWQISFTHIRKEMPTAARLLSLMSFFDRQGIPESLLQGRYQLDVVEEADFEEDLLTLTNYSLIGMNVDGREFEMHRLVQFSMKKWLELFDELESWKETFVKLMYDNFPLGEHKNWAVCQALYPHARAAVACQPAGGQAVKPWTSVLHKAAWYASEMGKYKEAEEMNRGALKAKEAAFGAEDPDTLASINDLAVVLKEQGKYEQAEALSRQALKGMENILGKKHPHTLVSMNNLAVVLSNQGKHKQVEALNRQVLKRREKTLGKEHPNTLTSVNNIAITLSKQGKYADAEALHRQVLEWREKVLGKEHPHTLQSVHNLAYVLHQRQQYEEASQLYQRACAGFQEKLGPDHPRTQLYMENYSALQQVWKP